MARGRMAVATSRKEKNEVEELLKSVKGQERRLKELKHSFDEKAAQNAMELIRKNNIQIVDLKFNDLPGLWQHFSIPATELTEMADIVKSIWVDGIG